MSENLLKFRSKSRRAAAGRAELLANPAIRAQILAGSIQTPGGLPHGLTNFDTFLVDFDTTPNSEGIPAKFGRLTYFHVFSIAVD